MSFDYPSADKRYHPVVIANYFIHCQKQQAFKIPLTVVKLVKLVYFAHGWSLLFYQRPLLDEAPEAWACGPSLSSVYYAFAHCGKKTIKQLGDYYDRTQAQWITKPLITDDLAIEKLLQLLWATYQSYSDKELCYLSSTSDSAWHCVMENCKVAHIFRVRKHLTKSNSV